MVLKENGDLLAQSLTRMNPAVMTRSPEENTAAPHLVRSSSVAGSIHVKVFRKLEEIETLRAFWSAYPGLRASDIDIFLTEQRNSTDVLRPHVMGLYRGEKLDALLIGRIVRRQLQFRVGYLSMQSSRLDVMDFGYGALRGNDNPENCLVLVREIIKSLKNGEADVAQLQYVNVDSTLLHYGRREVGFLLRDRFSPVRPHWKRELPNNVKDFQASLSSSERTRFRQIARKLAIDFQGEVNLVTLGKASDLDRIMEDLGELVQKTWQHKLGHGGFDTSAALRAKMRTEAEIGSLRVYILYLAGRPAAFWSGAAYQKTFYSDFMGYDSAYSKYSLGTYLLSQVLEDLCLHGIRAVDFGFSDEEYKRRFGNVMWHETSFYLFPATWNGLRLSLTRGVAALISNSSRALLQRAGLMQTVKRIWRKAASSSRR